MTTVFHFFDSRPLNVRSPRKPSDPLAQRVVTRTFRPSQTSCGTTERTRNLLLSIAEVSFKFHCLKREATPSTLPVSQAFTGHHSTSPGWYTSTLEPKPTPASKHILSQTAQYTEAKESLRSSGRDRHTYLPAFPDIVQIPEAPGKRSSLSVLPAVKQDLFNQTFAAFILVALWTQRRSTGRDFLLFPTDTVARHLTDVSTTGRPNQTGVPCVAILWLGRTSACRHLLPSILPLSTQLQ